MPEGCYLLSDRLWEGSWAEDAVVQDSERATYTEPSKVRKITHRGKFFKCESAHLVDPSPQRTPVLFQAGMSTSVSHIPAANLQGPQGGVDNS